MKVLLFVILVLLVGYVMVGCSNKTKYEQVLISTPMKCDFNISYEPQISTANLQDIVTSLTNLSYDSKELRRLIKVTPCLNVNYVR